MAKIPNGAGIIATHLNSWAYGVSSLIDWMAGIFASPTNCLLQFLNFVSQSNYFAQNR